MSRLGKDLFGDRQGEPRQPHHPSGHLNVLHSFFFVIFLNADEILNEEEVKWFDRRRMLKAAGLE